MMKKTAIALTLASLLALPVVTASDAWAAPVRSLQKEQNYDQYISKRQVVDQLLADAARINRVLEDGIRRHASAEYFWVHRRFKSVPAGEPDIYRKPV